MKIISAPVSQTNYRTSAGLMLIGAILLIGGLSLIYFFRQDWWESGICLISGMVGVSLLYNSLKRQLNPMVEEVIDEGDALLIRKRANGHKIRVYLHEIVQATYIDGGPPVVVSLEINHDTDFGRHIRFVTPYAFIPTPEIDDLFARIEHARSMELPKPLLHQEEA